MANDPTAATEAISKPAKPAKQSAVMSLVKAVAFISVIVILEVVAASMFVPGAEETRKIGEQLAAAEQADEEAENQSADGDENPELLDDEAATLGETREVSLDSHHIATFNPESRTNLNVNFNLFGVVLAEDESDFFTLYDSNQQRINEQIIVTVRSMTVADFTDPNLGLIKRKILEKTNRALGKPLLHDVIISEFAFVER